jgi:hypothetical protein
VACGSLLERAAFVGTEQAGLRRELNSTASGSTDDADGQYIPLGSLARRCICGKATGLRGCRGRHSNLSVVSWTHPPTAGEHKSD